MKKSFGDILLGFICVVLIVGVVIIAGYTLYAVGETLYWRLIEQPLEAKREKKAQEEASAAARKAEEEAAIIAAEQEAFYWDKYENKIYYQIFGEKNLIAKEYEYLGIVYDVYASGALFIYKSDEQFSIPEVMEYNGTEYPVIGMMGRELEWGKYLSSPYHFYLWNEETFPANWKYLFNVCFADGLTKVVIPETVEYYEISPLPYHYDVWGGPTAYVNNTLEEIVIESKFDPREWCFCKNFYEEHCYMVTCLGVDDIYNNDALCHSDLYNELNCMYMHYPNLKYVTIPAWIKYIPWGITYTFYRGYNTFDSLQVSKIDIPATVTDINLGAFDYVPLTEFDFYPGVTYSGAICGWKIKELNLTTDYSFPDTVEVVDCSELETLYISASTRKTEHPSYVIGNCPNLKNIFIDSGDLLCNVSISDCTSLETVTILNLPPSGNDNMFSNVNEEFTLKVPSKYVEYYSAIYKNLNVVACD